jgi:acyl-CoA thioester hydrolase
MQRFCFFKNAHLFSNARLMSSISHRLPASFTIQTRVQDTDLQGHVNNVKYYEFMDTAICSWSEKKGDTLKDNWRFIAETGLRYLHPSQFPDDVEVRFGTKHVGNSSVEYEVEMFNPSGDMLVNGKFVHVYVSKEGKPHPIPEFSRSLLNSIYLGDEK